MLSLPDEKIGDSIIRIVADKGAYSGRILRKGRKPGEVHTDADLALLQARLRNEAGKLHPNYHGMDEAIARFKRFFSDGFGGERFIKQERAYKAKRVRRLAEALPLEDANKASSEGALAIRPAFHTNLLSRFEAARAHALLGGPTGADFVRSAARFAGGNLAVGLAGMTAAIQPHGRPSWPLLTYLPHLWRPDEHMFLKPEVTVDFARRIGHRFQFDYSSDLSASVYESLMDLVRQTRTALAPLEPAGGLDIQSFIWVVGGYTDADLPVPDPSA